MSLFQGLNSLLISYSTQFQFRVSMSKAIKVKLASIDDVYNVEGRIVQIIAASLEELSHIGVLEGFVVAVSMVVRIAGLFTLFSCGS